VLSYIFNDTDIHSEIESREESLKRTIQDLESNYLLNVSEEDLVHSLAEEFQMNVPVWVWQGGLDPFGIFIWPHPLT